MLEKLFILSIPFILASCASTNHKYMRGSVAMKLDKKTAHVCLGDNEVKNGDKILFYYNDCEQIDPEVGGLKGLCTLKELGTGEVTKVHNSHYSTVKTDGSFSFKEGTLVQREKL
ncbi:MAG: hypothetical protein CME70_11380 [Halobacteriovorax sp.]|nr:hypothetical protein [Halobacteriovorax sp.]|tara:strand:- start:77670 stop:78014 length:345 start_codon:yes stop_codon:yes gene_type:complete